MLRTLHADRLHTSRQSVLESRFLLEGVAASHPRTAERLRHSLAAIDHSRHPLAQATGLVRRVMRPRLLTARERLRGAWEADASSSRLGAAVAQQQAFSPPFDGDGEPPPR